MRHTIFTILFITRERINEQFPDKLYPPFTRTAEAIKFLHGAVQGLRTFKRSNEAGILDSVIEGIKRDGLKYLDGKIREAQSIRDQVSARLEN